MTATYTFDVFSSLDGYGAASGNWTGYWGKQGPELLDHRLALYDAEQRMVFGANTYRAFRRMLAESTEESEVRDPWVTRMWNMPATVVSTTLEGPLDWPNATVVSGDAVDVVARLKEESDVPLRSHGSLSMNRALMAAGLVDRVQVTLFPVITGQTGLDPIFQGAADFDLELIEHRTLDGHIQELIYRPTLLPPPQAFMGDLGGGGDSTWGGLGNTWGGGKARSPGRHYMTEPDQPGMSESRSSKRRVPLCSPSTVRPRMTTNTP